MRHTGREVVHAIACCQVAHRVAAKEAFIQFLTRANGISDKIPCQSEELNAFTGCALCP